MMRTILALSLLMVSLMATSRASADPKHLIIEELQMRFMAEPSVRSPFRSVAAQTIEGVLTQKLNHDDPAEARTFGQRYWTNSTYAKGANPPVLLHSGPLAGYAEAHPELRPPLGRLSAPDRRQAGRRG